jgi:flagellar basal body-associated protein FliL
MPPSGYPPPPQQSGALPPGHMPPTGAPPAGYPSPSGMPPTGGYPAPTGAPSMQPYGYPGYPVPARPANTNTTLIVVLSVIAAVVVIGAGIGIISAFTSTHSSVSGASQHYKVGDHVAIGNTWVITVNGATESMGNQFDQQQLQAGDTYVIVDVTVKNASSQTQDLLGYIDFAVKDSTGEEHQQTFFSSESVPDGNISPGDILRGQIAFEVPANDHHLEFLYTDDSFGSTPVIWDITV